MPILEEKMKNSKNTQTLGIIIGNRDVFPTSLAKEGREDILKAFNELGIKAVILSQQDSEHGLVGKYQDAKKCAALFDKHRRTINGVFVSLPNFGDERAIADTLKMAELGVPVFIHAFPDRVKKMRIGERRDSFCGKLSVCANLRQYGIPFSIGKFHTTDPQSKEFKDDLHWFLGVCRVFNGIRRARIGSIGSRVTPFKTVRYSEKLLEQNGISVETADLHDIISAMEKLPDSSGNVQHKLSLLDNYASMEEPIPAKHRMTIAKLAVALEQWVKENELDAYTIQCWPVMQEIINVFPCAVMSMMGEKLIPGACETDVMGAVSMYALQLAGCSLSALFDWNNNYDTDPDKLVFFHCGNCPKSMLDNVRIGYNVIANEDIGKDKSYSSCWGRLKKGPMTFARISTDDIKGRITAYIGEGKFTDDRCESFGVVGVAKIADLQSLLRFACKHGFGHHVAVSHSQCCDILSETFTGYFGWDVYYHKGGQINV